MKKMFKVYFILQRLILVGSNTAENRFKLIQIDRTIQNDLHLFEDDVSFFFKNNHSLLYVMLFNIEIFKICNLFYTSSKLLKHFM